MSNFEKRLVAWGERHPVIAIMISVVCGIGILACLAFICMVLHVIR